MVLMALVLTAGCADVGQSDTAAYVDIGIIRADAEGATLWDQTLDSSGDDYYHVSPLPAVASPSGDRVFVGYHLLDPYPYPCPESPLYTGEISAFGPEGKTLWIQGMEWDWPAVLAPTPDEGYLCIPDIPEERSVVNIGPDGRSRWAVFASAFSFEPTAVASTAAGCSIVGGKNALAWLDENGTVLSTENMPLGDIDTIVPTADGGCAVAGTVAGRSELTRLDAGGKALWSVSVPFSLLEAGEGEGGDLVLLGVEEGKDAAFDQGREIVYGRDGTVLREETFAVPSGCPVALAPDRGSVIAAVEDAGGNPGAGVSTGGSPSYVHLIKLNATGHQEWDRTVGSRPGRYHVVSIGPAGADGYVVIVGETGDGAAEPT